MQRNCRILLIPGSLRARSSTAAVLRTAVDVAPTRIAVVLFEGLAALPHFNPDDDRPPLPHAVGALRAAIRQADALLFSAPEYAGALPGSFKNLLDWTIGDPSPGSIYGKPVAWINASPREAADAHDELRRVLRYAGATVVDAACAHLPTASSAIDERGLVADDTVRAGIAQALDRLAEGIHACAGTGST